MQVAPRTIIAIFAYLIFDSLQSFLSATMWPNAVSWYSLYEQDVYLVTAIQFITIKAPRLIVIQIK